MVIELPASLGVSKATTSVTGAGGVAVVSADSVCCAIKVGEKRSRQIRVKYIFWFLSFPVATTSLSPTVAVFDHKKTIGKRLFPMVLEPKQAVQDPYPDVEIDLSF